MLYVLTLDLIENALLLFYVCPCKVGPSACLGNAEIWFQYNQEKENTKLN